MQICIFTLQLRKTDDANLRFWRACFPRTVHLIMQYMEPVSEWSCWRMFIETWPRSELNRGNVLLNNLKAPSSMC